MPDYSIVVEDVGGLMFGHVTVARWTPRIARALRAEADRTVAAYGPPLFALGNRPHGGDHMKFDHFVRFLGFVYHSVMVVYGQPRVAYVRWS